MPKLKMIANKGLLQIFFALLLVAIIMFVSNYLVYKNSITGIYNQVSENNKLVVKNMIRDFDDSFKDINDVIYSIQQLPYGAWSDDGTADLHGMYMTAKDMKTIASSTDFIEDVVVFHRGSDLAITLNGTIRLEELMPNRFGHPSYNLDYWKSLTRSKHPFRVLPSQWYTEKDGSAEKRRRLIPVLGSNHIYDSNILVFLNYDKLLRHVNQESMMKGTSLIVMDQDRNIILNTEENWDLVDMLYELNFNGSPEATLKRNDYVYNLFKSDFNGFIYINKAPYRFADLNAVGDANRQIMAVAIACALVLSMLLSFYLYRPVQNLRKLLGGRDDKGADYLNIRTGIVKIQEENESFKHQLDLFRLEMRRAAFLNALHESPVSRETELKMQRYFAEFYRERHFVLTLIRVRPKAGGDDSPSAPALDETAAFLQAELAERLEEAYVFPLAQGTFAATIALKRPSDREQAVKQLRGFLNKTMLEEWQSYFADAAVSRSYAAETANVRRAYVEAADAFAYRNVHADDAVVDVHSIRYTWKVYAPPDEIEKASHSLFIGNADESVRIAGGLLEQNMQRHVHVHQLATVARTVFYGLLKHVETSDMETKAVVALEMEFNRSVDAAAGYEDIRDALFRAIRVIAEAGKPGAKSKLDPTSIAQYIERNYMGNLHLDHMAEQLETTPKYFSNYFKKTFGVNFVEYLNKVRLAHAKELLKNTELSIAEIGEKTGYLNSSTFTSTFKKYYGISPSEYRKNKQLLP
ncbi:helix-turn-helix domain-containing protein [Paenibacillus flagellatus]|uniref:AraC family transcriptional regulator n=1 Tax=Paenibacillus flagellatus TaxID=2211139 RepID=A0A2V5KG34_9BACL|nr:AraC family transcriptional regulator [Paenibacillus flagellatus]PYI53120.1 AraC family transcriptional regulator [Paenibacillus flagellatus]